MGELEPLAHEGTVIPRKGVTVKELIQKLQEFPEDMYVVTADCCYGNDSDVQAYTINLGSWDSEILRELGLEVGDDVLLID